MKTCAVVTGDIITGFIHYGPFDNYTSAIEWAEENLRSLSWILVDLYDEVE